MFASPNFQPFRLKIWGETFPNQIRFQTEIKVELARQGMFSGGNKENEEWIFGWKRFKEEANSDKLA